MYAHEKGIVYKLLLIYSINKYKVEGSLVVLMSYKKRRIKHVMGENQGKD